MKIIHSVFVTLIVLAANSANAAVIDVFAQANSSSNGTGASTGIFFSAGDYFTATAGVEDLWNAGTLPRWSNADGLVGNLFATGSDDSGQALGTLIGKNFGTWTQHGLTAAYGSLVGSINGNYFLMGTNYAGNAVDTGELLLSYWDSNNGDNTEQIAVTITTAVAEPSSIALLGLGLAALGFSRRKTKA
jgi:hypothetical protein